MSLQTNYDKWSKMAADIEDDSSDEEQDMLPRRKQPAQAAQQAAQAPAAPTASSSSTSSSSSRPASDFADIPKLVRESCAEVARHATLVEIKEDAIAALAAQLTTDTQPNSPPTRSPTSAAYTANTMRVRVPFRFAPDELANFIGLCHFLDFGSGYVPEMRRLLPDVRDPWGEESSHVFEPVLYALVGAVVEGNKLTAEDVGALSLFKLSQLLKMPLTREQVVSGPIRQDIASDFRPLVDRYHHTLMEVGRVLQERSFVNLGRFLHSTAGNGLVSGVYDPSATTTAAASMQRIAHTFPSLRDECMYALPDGRSIRVGFYSRVMGGVGALHVLGVSGEGEGGVVIDNKGDLCATPNALLPAELIRRGVLQVSPALAEALNSGKDIAQGSQQEVELRACSVHAVEKIVAATDGKVTAFDLSVWLCGQAKEHRGEIHPLLCKHTPHY